MKFTSRQLKAFVLTAQHESFSRAAEEMFVTQSGMSILVRELESQVGFRLFERTTRKVKLTDFGSRFLPVASRCLVDLEAAARKIRNSASIAMSTLMLAIGPMMTELDGVAEYVVAL